jgi:ATP-dependent Zn protease
MSEKERKLTAYHEGGTHLSLKTLSSAGHAICALYVEGAMPLYKATIVPRGQALGMVQRL